LELFDGSSNPLKISALFFASIKEFPSNEQVNQVEL
jgi:hypothetical protein